MIARQYQIAAADGVPLGVYDGGNRAGPEILFIHGFSQCSLCWHRQFADPILMRDFRLTAFDIRGHGASGKPVDQARYNDDGIFAADVRSVITALGLAKPVLVGWSYAGRLIGDYVRAFGSGGIAGINYVCARTNNDPQFKGPGTQWLSDMVSNDVARNISGTRAFLENCFARPQPPEDFATAMAYNMLVLPEIRAAHLSRAGDDGAVLATLDLPVLVTQGSDDLLVSRGLGELTARLVPNSVLSVYEGVGHAPFVEDAGRFNRELAAFVRSANEQKPK